LAMKQPLAVLFSQGKYVPGQSAEQWRGEGQCVKIPLTDILHCVPRYTVTGMLVSKRIEKEFSDKSYHLRGGVSPVRSGNGAETMNLRD
jgi:hypothetical protein